MFLYTFFATFEFYYEKTKYVTIGTVCGAIFNKAGWNELQAECDSIGHCDTGNAVITNAYSLKCKKVIHHSIAHGTDFYKSKPNNSDKNGGKKLTIHSPGAVSLQPAFVHGHREPYEKKRQVHKAECRDARNQVFVKTGFMEPGRRRDPVRLLPRVPFFPHIFDLDIGKPPRAEQIRIERSQAGQRRKDQAEHPQGKTKDGTIHVRLDDPGRSQEPEAAVRRGVKPAGNHVDQDNGGENGRLDRRDPDDLLRKQRPESEECHEQADTGKPEQGAEQQNGEKRKSFFLDEKKE